MGKVALYIATSLDGFIADRDGNIDWLDRVDDRREDYGYAAFYSEVELVVMGRRTWDQIRGFGANPYAGKPVFVFSRSAKGQGEAGVHFTNTDPAEWITGKRDETDGTIWLVGGSGLVHACAAAGVIDEYIISVVPTLLGGGIPLFRTPLPVQQLSLVECRRYPSGLVQLTYVPAAAASTR